VKAKDLRIGEPNQVLRAPDGLRMSLVMTPGASRGKRLEMEWHVPPGKRPYTRPEFERDHEADSDAP
jgi:hypothetical protein